jgi:hypothetical protein
MVIAVAVVWVVQVAADQIVEVLTMGHELVTAALPVRVAVRVLGPHVSGRTGLCARIADGELAFVDVIAMQGMEVSVMQVIDVVSVLDGGVSAPWPVRVLVPCVDEMFLRHDPPSFHRRI